MLRLKPFEIVQPTSIDEATQLLGGEEKTTRAISGGTDLVPNLKLAYGRPEVLVSLRNIEGMNSIAVHGQILQIGAGITLNDLIHHPLVREHIPILAEGANRIASPQIRNMGTLGGNICLDTRCRYINQSELFREALGGCLKSHGDRCHVVPGGKNCVAALSSDTIPILIALGATVDITGAESRRSIPIEKLYGSDGCNHIQLTTSEIIATIQIPIPTTSTKFTYSKWAMRKSIDFPLVSVAIRLEIDPKNPQTLEGGLIVVSVLGPKPKLIPLDKYASRSLDSSLAADLGELAYKRSKTLPNVPYESNYRRKRLAVEVKRAVLSLSPKTP